MDSRSITFNGDTVRLLAENNQIAGRFDTAALFANNSEDYTFRGNLVEGGAEIAAGIRIAESALRGTVERNVVNGTSNALFLERPPAVTFSVRLNDFAGYRTAIRTTDDDNLPTTLGGNYWGVPCPGLDPAQVLFVSLGVNPFVTDTSYGVPVAATPDDELPAPCP